MYVSRVIRPSDSNHQLLTPGTLLSRGTIFIIEIKSMEKPVGKGYYQ